MWLEGGKAPLEGIHNADIEKRRLVLRPERATQQICECSLHL